MLFATAACSADQCGCMVMQKWEKLISKAVPGTLLGGYRDQLRALPKLMLVRRCWELLHYQVAPLEEDLRTLSSAASCFPLDLRSLDFTQWLPACKQVRLCACGCNFCEPNHDAARFVWA